MFQWTPEEKRTMGVKPVTTISTAKAVNMVCALAEAIRELKEVPSGHLYARVMGHLDIADYNSIIDVLKRSDLVSETARVLRWIGPEVK